MCKYNEMKNELKELALKIRNSKSETKNYQREHNGNVTWELLSSSYHLKSEFRHKHIAYCMLRGRAYEEIERTVSPDNRPDMRKISDIMNSYRMEESHEVVCPCS